MKVAIVVYEFKELGWSVSWRELCAANSIEFKEFNGFDPNFIENLMTYEPEITLWRSENIPYKKIKDETQRQLLNKTGLRIVPNWRTHYLYDHKVRQSYIFKLHGIPHPETKIFFNEAYALKYIENAKYPFVIKADGGAGAKSFRLVETKEEALKRCNEAFRGEGRATGREHEKDILYTQEYIPAPQIWRVGMFKNKVAFGFIQKNGPGAIASFRTTKEYCEVPKELLNMTMKINDGMRWDWCMYDIIWSKRYKKYLILEITDTCDAASPAGRSLTYYREGIEWLPRKESPTPQEIIFNLFVLKRMR